ncbi:family 43 glycoside hydrolase [Cryphonectria parasitica EP155]|uniref:Family 43 glycoside hydrolase n=1 Tax=Cryphonectria parasitica (strain ATCC 38755 / EP155) TaxID=660469 RepID=A0A9P4XWB2_CRYP1|nr:family 43 glycoside hydrolase [Cryphonectria parasitica EP155]KAF3762149.1 family 43 glycoside hydrolase [Cryphonectria parasitica EP155]
MILTLQERRRGLLLFLFQAVLLSGHVLLARGQSFDPNAAKPEIWNPLNVGTNKTTNTTYSNPIFTQNVGDPWISKYTDIDGQQWYLFTYTTNDNITIRRSKALTDNWDHAEERVVFNPNNTGGEAWSTSLWAPEIHNISGTFYIIFTATPDADNPPPLQDALCPINCPAVNHRMFVLEGGGPDPWLSNFTLKGMLDTYDQFAIDGTYFFHNDHMYHVYSCWQEKYSAWPANLCITHMSDPWTVDTSFTNRRIISVPSEPWERVPYGRPDTRLATNEGPQQLVNPTTGQNFIIYSAARVNTPFYCLGLLELVGDDPMEYQSWRKHRDGCVFHQNSLEGVYGTGHASFTTSPDGSEHYLVYHAQTTAEPLGDISRTVRAQKFTWNDDGTPNFPLAKNGPFPVPAGQNGQVMVAGEDYSFLSSQGGDTFQAIM